MRRKTRRRKTRGTRHDPTPQRPTLVRSHSDHKLQGGVKACSKNKRNGNQVHIEKRHSQIRQTAAIVLWTCFRKVVGLENMKEDPKNQVNKSSEGLKKKEKKKKHHPCKFRNRDFINWGKRKGGIVNKKPRGNPGIRPPSLPPFPAAPPPPLLPPKSKGDG